MFKHLALPNLVVFAFQLGGYGLGLWLLLHNSGYLVAGVIILAAVKIQAAYLFHEFAHGTIFKRGWANRWGGEVVLWMVGNWVGFKRLQVNHLQHHAKKVDFLSIDHQTLLVKRPALRRLIEACEWAYLPALEFLIRFETSRRALSDPHGRVRIALMLVSRGALFGVLWWHSPWALFGYFLAFVLMIHGLRFMDTHQHTYEVYRPGSTVPYRDKSYEQAHTFSNFFARWRWLNWLTLNFGYHNAHHAEPALPWHALPALHQKLAVERNFLPGEDLISPFHRYRVQRVMVKDNFGDPYVPGTFVGFPGLSFLN